MRAAATCDVAQVCRVVWFSLCNCGLPSVFLFSQAVVTYRVKGINSMNPLKNLPSVRYASVIFAISTHCRFFDKIISQKSYDSVPLVYARIIRILHQLNYCENIVSLVLAHYYFTHV